MTNYICINGTKRELTEEQIKQFGFVTGQISVDELSQIIKSGKACDRFNIRDAVNIGGNDYIIIGFDHDAAIDRDTPHTITLMGERLLPARRMHGGACKNGWVNTELRKWLNGEYIGALPEELIPHICAVEKLTHNSDGEPFKTEDKLFIPSESELFGSAMWAACEDGPRYEAFATAKDRIRIDENGDSDWYWSRSAHGGTSTYFAAVSGNGGGNYISASYASIRVPVCFCFA